jgi:hypothetical protein
MTVSKQRKWWSLDALLGNPVALIIITLAVIIIYHEVIKGKIFVNDVFVNCKYSDVLVRAVTNGANHAHPWLATTVTIIVLILIIVIIILYAGALDEM